MVKVPDLLGRRALLRGSAALAATASAACDMPHTSPATTTDACFFDSISLIAGDQRNCQPPKDTPVDIGWHLHTMKVPEAWRFMSEERRGGKGILIGHIDTGVARHREFDAGGVLWERGYDFIDDIPRGYDPLVEHVEYIEQIGHGTSTASVIVSRGGAPDLPWREPTCGGTTGPGRITGVAPAADLIPVRAFRIASTRRLDRITKAIRYLTTEQRVDVITMALGWPFADDDTTLAIKDAVASDIIVLAASGNFIPTVTFPGNLRDVIAVGGTGPDNKAWCGGSRGSQVTVSAPADKVWRAYRDDKSFRLDLIGPRYGTSYAVSLTAGVAALWLAHHGPAGLSALKRQKGKPNLQELFRTELRRTAWQPEGWDSDRLGSGIVNAEALLRGEYRSSI